MTSLEAIEQAKRDAIAARGRVDSALGALQHRLKPANLAGEAWDGVKDKSADLADGALAAVRKRPAAVSMAVGAVALFLAREPIKRVVTRLVVGDEEEEPDDRIVTRIETDDARLNASAPFVDDAALTEGVK